MESLKQNQIFLSLGSNLGNRSEMLKQAIEAIGAKCGEAIAVSNLYQTEPVGFASNLPFLNCCIEIETEYSPTELVAALLEIELQQGRTRNKEQLGYANRLIDIDIVFYNHLVLDSPNLIVPHPRMHLRRFVLLPLSELCPQFVHPVLKKTVADLLAECADVSKVELTLER